MERLRQQLTKDVSVDIAIEQVLHSGNTKYQHVLIFRNREFGNVLALDRIINSTESDEFVYHEMIVHPAMFSHPAPGRVCIIGGAEGAVLREVLRHPVERAVMVDIDGELVELCKRLLPEFHRGSFDDSRACLVAGDGMEFLEKTDERFDVIIVDLSDPLPGSPALRLFTREFYELAFSRLTDEGVMAVQAEDMDVGVERLHCQIVKTIRQVFPLVKPYPYFQRSFFGTLGFVLASKKHDPASAQVIAKAKGSPLEFRYYSARLHSGMFALPSFLEKSYLEEIPVLTDKQSANYRETGHFFK